MGKHMQYIFEEAYVPNNDGLKIIQEGYDESGHKKITVRAILQTAGNVNQNGRVYTPEVLQSIVEQLLPKVKSRSLLAELDHPLPETSDPAVLKKRAVVVSLKNACALITDLQFDGSQVIGVLEILNTEAGKIVQALIKDGVKIGFSLRALGVVETDPQTGKTIVAKTKAITYDVVSNPSHASATIVEVINENSSLSDLLESYVEMTENEADEILTEAVSEIEEGQDRVCVSGACVRGNIQEVVEFIVENVLDDKTLNKLTISV